MTIADDNVLSNYHDIFIPKAVEYSAGVLDYFFRGAMDVSLIGYDTNLLQYTNLIVNTSSQDFSGGSFYLLLETNGVRTLVQSNGLSGTLASGASTNMTFPGPLPTNQYKLFLVYQGTIGWSNNTALDPVDSNICIAAERVWIKQTKTYIYHPWLSDIGLTNGDTITTNLESDNFPFTITPDNYEVEIIYTQFDDTGKIGSISADINYDWLCEEFRDIGPAVLPADDVSISADGKRLSVQISATDCYDRGGLIGWEPVIIKWKAWYGNNP